MRSALKKSRHVFAVSESTKADIGSYYGSRIEAKTTVTYPGVSDVFQPQNEAIQEEVKVRYRLEKPFLLYIGNCKQHKNVGMLIDAFTQAQLPGLELVLVTGGIECAAFGKRQNVRCIQGVSLEDLPALYSASRGCVTATLMEGFCLPLIEAMACKTAVLATNTGPIPEVCAEHAILVEPSVTRIADGMRALVLDQSVRSSERLSAAKHWAERYSWKETAAQTASVFRTILESEGHK